MSGRLLLGAALSTCASALLTTRDRRSADRLFREFRAHEFRDDSSVPHDENPVAHPHDLWELGGNEQHRHAVRRERVDLLTNLGLRSHIDAARRLIKDQQRRLRVEPFTEYDLLLVSAAESGDRRVCRRSSDVEVANVGAPVHHGV